MATVIHDMNGSRKEPSNQETVEPAEPDSFQVLFVGFYDYSFDYVHGFLFVRFLANKKSGMGTPSGM